jgi:hypothetical protein
VDIPSATTATILDMAVLLLLLLLILMVMPKEYDGQFDSPYGIDECGRE